MIVLTVFLFSILLKNKRDAMTKAFDTKIQAENIWFKAYAHL